MSNPRVRTESRSGRERAGAAAPATSHTFTELLSPDVRFDFVGKRKFFLVLSSVLNVLSVVLLVTWGLNFGIDFAGGTDVRVRFKDATTAHALREDLGALDLPDLTVQEFGGQGKEFLLRFEPETATAMNTVAETIKGALAKSHPGEQNFEILSVESVGPKVGAELRQRGFLAVAFTTLFMGIYIAFRFELSFGVGAVIALAHDVMIALLALVVSRTIFDLTTLAAMLTVIGFSVHDTIIVSDRVRENLRKMRRASLAEVINLSINETLSRTILTTGTALLVLFALYFLGGPGLEPFAFTLIVGFLTGTYSSIYIAAPVVLFWSKTSKLAVAE
ncbi:MAG: protein translocase subunit SecF [Deltaproteobacteria bacterium]|nr:protein translocase subunit SecF [Deltaproteobacteria bacterium]